ncbi:MAG: hypothetical protein ACRD1Q_10510, partial [Vicinamibacterales bacterium]
PMTAPTRTNRKVSFLIGAVAFLLAAPASAQPVARSFQELRGLVAPGDTIYVTDAGGTTTKGTLVDLSGSLLILRARRDSPAPLLRMSERDVNNIRVQRSDPWWNGPLIGFATGAIPGLLIELGGRSSYEKFSGAAAAGLGTIGLFTGLLVDVLNREKAIVYVHAAGQESRKMSLTPLLSRSTVGVRMSFGF